MLQLQNAHHASPWPGVAVVVLVLLLSTAGYGAFVQRAVARRTDVLPTPPKAST